MAPVPPLSILATPASPHWYAVYLDETGRQILLAVAYWVGAPGCRGYVSSVEHPGMYAADDIDMVFAIGLPDTILMGYEYCPETKREDWYGCPVWTTAANRRMTEEHNQFLEGTLDR